MRARLQAWPAPAADRCFCCCCSRPAGARRRRRLPRQADRVGPASQIEGRPATDRTPAPADSVETTVGQPLSMLRGARDGRASASASAASRTSRCDATRRGDGVALLVRAGAPPPGRRVSLFTGIAGVPGVDEGRLRRAVTRSLRRVAAARPRAGHRAPRRGRAARARLPAARACRRAWSSSTRPTARRSSSRSTPGARTTIGAVEVIGAPGIPERELLDRLGLTPGAPYEPRGAGRAHRRLPRAIGASAATTRRGSPVAAAARRRRSRRRT